jgi:multidrug resistance efflux pump
MVAAEETVAVPGPDEKTLPDTDEGKPDNIAKRIYSHPWFKKALVVFIVLIVLAGILYWVDLQSKVYIENAQITAPEISLNPVTSGVIDEIYVSVGDTVKRDQILAKVGDEVIRARTHGVITGVRNTPGQIVNPLYDTKPVIAMIDTRELRLTGRVQEDKGLKDIHPGQYVDFTMDAFPSSRYEGTVERVAPAAREGDIVFSISDKRQEQEFDVTVSYDVTAYPELKNGMSGKMWISK